MAKHFFLSHRKSGIEIKEGAWPPPQSCDHSGLERMAMGAIQAGIPAPTATFIARQYELFMKDDSTQRALFIEKDWPANNDPEGWERLDTYPVKQPLPGVPVSVLKADGSVDVAQCANWPRFWIPITENPARVIAWKKL